SLRRWETATGATAISAARASATPTASSTLRVFISSTARIQQSEIHHDLIGASRAEGGVEQVRQLSRAAGEGADAHFGLSVRSRVRLFAIDGDKLEHTGVEDAAAVQVLVWIEHAVPVEVFPHQRLHI